MIKKLLVVSILLSLYLAQNVFAASCDDDKLQMQDQVGKYGSISSKGCPRRDGVNGIVIINNVQTARNYCNARCVYFGQQYSVACSWIKGNWGPTLTCNLSAGTKR